MKTDDQQLSSINATTNNWNWIGYVCQFGQTMMTEAIKNKNHIITYNFSNNCIIPWPQVHDGWMDEWMARRWKEPALVAAIKVPTYPVRIHLIQFRCLLWRQKVSLSPYLGNIPFHSCDQPPKFDVHSATHTQLASQPACLPLCWETCMHSVTSHVCPHVVLGIHNCRLETKADGIFGCFNGWGRAGFWQWPFWNMSTWRTEWLYRTIMNGPSVGTANNVNNY